MGANDKEMAEAWCEAALDLNIDVTIPITSDIPKSSAGAFIGLVHQFGSRAGTLLGTIDGKYAEIRDQVEARGYFLSQLNPDAYRSYDRQLFIDTLNDWGYFGSEPAPAWYTGTSL